VAPLKTGEVSNDRWRRNKIQPRKGDNDTGTASDNAGDSRAEYMEPSKGAEVVDIMGLVTDGCVILGELKGSCVTDVPDTDGSTGTDDGNDGAGGTGGGYAAPEDGGVVTANCAAEWLVALAAGEETAAAAAAAYRIGGS
jgi:hypothetical protein